MSLNRARRETSLFLLGLALIALHVIDDNFLQPQPGTSAGDHLVSGLVPLAVLALAAWAYPRLRDGRRGALALVLGPLGVAAGIEAVHYANKVGASGDDYTGLLCIPAGLLLIGLGAVTLWTTRRLDGSRPRRYGRRALLAVAGYLVASTLVMPIGVAYEFVHLGRAVVPADHVGVAHEQVAFRTSDGLTLKGWYVPSKNGAAVIAFPGRNGPQKHTRMLARHGYGVLLFDRRGEGESDGDPNAFGWGGEKDITAAIAFLQHRPDVDPDRIGGLGLSVGGELMLQTAAHDHDLKAVVAEGAGSRSVHEDLEMPGKPSKWMELPGLVVRDAALAVFSNHARPDSLKDLVTQIAPRPMFLIFATKGTGGQELPLNTKYFHAAGGPKTLWEIPEAQHTGGIRARPAEYERRVVGFFDKALLP